MQTSRSLACWHLVKLLFPNQFLNFIKARQKWNGHSCCPRSHGAYNQFLLCHLPFKRIMILKMTYGYLLFLLRWWVLPKTQCEKCSEFHEIIYNVLRKNCNSVAHPMWRKQLFVGVCGLLYRIIWELHVIAPVRLNHWIFFCSCVAASLNSHPDSF